VDTWLQEHVCIVWFHFARIFQILEFFYTLLLNLSEDFILFDPKPPKMCCYFLLLILVSCPLHLPSSALLALICSL